ncbi:hypothetical protein NDU88_006840 [Pleurodeles waltl]|uniref:Uncharacterized protein n=1 Tax=Pleurodeles waltl TaxID=8319 RepID=A0AAV7PMJ7_PLEWA|nr:hypothetical protein NDU88_006840 [Pleurodeles waltl]
MAVGPIHVVQIGLLERSQPCRSAGTSRETFPVPHSRRTVTLTTALVRGEESGPGEPWVGACAGVVAVRRFEVDRLTGVCDLWAGEAAVEYDWRRIEVHFRFQRGSHWSALGRCAGTRPAAAQEGSSAIGPDTCNI